MVDLRCKILNVGTPGLRSCDCVARAMRTMKVHPWPICYNALILIHSVARVPWVSLAGCEPLTSDDYWETLVLSRVIKVEPLIDSVPQVGIWPSDR